MELPRSAMSRRTGGLIWLVRTPLLGGACALLVGGVTVSSGTPAGAAVRPGLPFETPSLDGSGNNVAHPTWGTIGSQFSRTGPAHYGDGIGTPVSGPNSRYISNRVHNDVGQTILNGSQLSQWGFLWGQIVDHTLGLHDTSGTDEADIPFDASDPLERYRDDLGGIPFVRSPAAPGTGTSKKNPRQQINTVSAYFDAFPVYGGTDERLDWLREGKLDGDPADNKARLMLPGGYLPRRTARGDADHAPAMDHDGLLAANPGNAAVAGDVRANENIALQGLQTLMVREHNRIVGLLPGTLSEEEKFQIARRVVIAEEQYITYTEFLPAMGVSLPAYTGYDPDVRTDLSNEFSTIGFRAHSQVNGAFQIQTNASRYSHSTLAALRAQGVQVTVHGGRADIAVPLNIASFNPDLVGQLQLGPLLQGLALQPQTRNDEQIDDQLRSTLFQIPVSGNPDCRDGQSLPQCFQGVMDLGAIDIERGRDHGMPSYNQLRKAYGLPPRTSFAQITGESSSTFPSDPKLTPGNEINDPDSLDFTSLRDIFGTKIALSDKEARKNDVVSATRRTPLAARLRAIYKNKIGDVDAFVGMVSEPPEPGGQLGELQRAIWTREFTRLRDGDRFFYGNQKKALNFIKNTYGIDYRKNLGDIIAANTDVRRDSLPQSVFFVHGDVPPTACRVAYVIDDQRGRRSGGFDATVDITNSGTKPINSWTLRFSLADGQRITKVWNGTAGQKGVDVPIVNSATNGTIAPGDTLRDVRFHATWRGTNAVPAKFSLNTTPCKTK